MEDKRDGIFRIGPIRPPSEADSLLLQVTSGCTWNKCKFCSLYRGSKFRTYSVESIKADIDTMGKYRDRILNMNFPDGRFNHEAVWEDIKQLPFEEQNCYYIIRDDDYRPDGRYDLDGGTANDRRLDHSSASKIGRAHV